MEKKTVGKFISVLRKANGMTQRELAEKLFVSDKTVSRWECDECAPDLTLIPAIAEIFGITTDELLRGERNNQSAGCEAESSKPKSKSDKQFKSMLYNRLTKYKNLTLVSVGLATLAIIAAMIFNLGFLKGIVGFCVSSVFIVAGIICQICFASSARMPIDDEEEYLDAVKKANSDITKKALCVIWATLVIFAFTLPIAQVGGAYVGLTFDSWLVMGSLYAFIAFVAIYVAYVVAIRKILVKKELLCYSQTEESRNKYQSKLLLKMLSVAGCIALALLAAVLVLNSIGVYAFSEKHIFTDDDDWAEFKEFMKKGEPYYGYYNDNGDLVLSDPIVENEYSIEYLYDKNGEEYMWFEYKERFYSRIEYLEFNEYGNPTKVAVYTNEDIARAGKQLLTVENVLLSAIWVEALVCAAVYAVKIRKQS